MGIREYFAVTVHVFSIERLRDSGINGVYVLFSIKYYLKKLNLINSVAILTGLGPHATVLFFLTPILANKMRLLHI